MSWFSSSKPKVSHAEALSAKPIRLVDAPVEPTEDGGAKLVVPLVSKRKWIFKLPEGASKTFELDPMGRLVWELCDGKNSVQQIIRKVERRYNLNPREAEVSTRAFIQTLTRKRLIGITIRQEAGRT